MTTTRDPLPIGTTIKGDGSETFADYQATVERDDRTVCWSHYRVEPVTASTFLVCGECWHAFQTERDLLDADEVRRGKRMRAGNQIGSCPHCAHDL